VGCASYTLSYTLRDDETGSDKAGCNTACQCPLAGARVQDIAAADTTAVEWMVGFACAGAAGEQFRLRQRAIVLIHHIVYAVYARQAAKPADAASAQECRAGESLSIRCL
jgi:hypothetical protein